MFRFGVDYYPEHWSRDRWPIDAQLMQEAGINTVRMAEFAWCLLEPSPDVFDFTWLDQAIDLLQAHGIQTVLGTPTASQPPWVMDMYPDAYRVRLTRHQANYGGRRDYCPTHTGFLERCRIIAKAMAEYYSDNPAVIGWQVDNEFNRLCYCSSCRNRFQSWLRHKYGSLDALNAAWGTVFWSHIYTRWEQIPLPEDHGRTNSYGPNPGLDLDFRRFTSDAVVHFQQQQMDILRELCPDHFITHNTGFGLDDLNFFEIAQPLDFISLDLYPREPGSLGSGDDPAVSAMTYDTMRGLKRKNFWMTEMQSGPGGWTTIGATPRPGEMRLWTYQAIAHGADAMIYFRWRSALFGAEQFWHGVLDHDGRPRRRYWETQRIGSELERVGDQVMGATTRARAAVIHSYDSRYCFQAQPNHDDFDYVRLLESYYSVLYRHNIMVDIVTPTGDLDEYQLVVAPALHVLSKEAAANLQSFVENGGTLLLTARSGVKTEANSVVELALPGLLSEICGVEVEEFDALPAGKAVPVKLDLPGQDAGGESVQCELWVDVLSPTTAQVVARYQEGYYAGEAAVTLNAFGRGRAVYVGALGGDALHERIVDWLIGEIGLAPALLAPVGVEAVERRSAAGPLLFLLNHTSLPQEVGLPGPMTDLVLNQRVDGTASLEPKGVMILRPTQYQEK